MKLQCNQIQVPPSIYGKQIRAELFVSEFRNFIIENILRFLKLESKAHTSNEDQNIYWMTTVCPFYRDYLVEKYFYIVKGDSALEDYKEWVGKLQIRY